MKKTGIVILAAGSSSRLGQPKQLLPYRGKNFLLHAIDAAQIMGIGNVVVILGSRFALIEEQIKHRGCSIIYNVGWEEGMSSSIRVGLASLQSKHKDLEAVILMVCDQPYLDASILIALLDTADKTGKNIVASMYTETMGTPVLFGRRYFENLMDLQGNEGAKLLISKFEDDLAFVSFANGEIDIDTLDDYRQLDIL